MPVANTVKLAVAPARISKSTGCCVMVGAMLTVMLAVALFTTPPAPVMRTQKFADWVNAGVVNVAPVAPVIGLVVSPEVPIYHW